MIRIPVAVSGLVEVDEVHIDLRPGNFAVVLGVQVSERLFEQAQPGDPHLGG